MLRLESSDAPKKVQKFFFFEKDPYSPRVDIYIRGVLALARLFSSKMFVTRIRPSQFAVLILIVQILR
jgi:hypothetical protein